MASIAEEEKKKYDVENPCGVNAFAADANETNAFRLWF